MIFNIIEIGQEKSKIWRWEETGAGYKERSEIAKGGGHGGSKDGEQNLNEERKFQHFFVNFDSCIEVGKVGERPFITCERSNIRCIDKIGFSTGPTAGEWEFSSFGKPMFFSNTVS